MTTTIAINSDAAFASLLNGRRLLPVAEAQALVQRLGAQVAAWHSGGRVHRRIGPASLTRHADGSLLLAPPIGECRLGSIPDDCELLPRELLPVLPQVRRSLRGCLSIPDKSTCTV